MFDLAKAFEPLGVKLTEFAHKLDDSRKKTIRASIASSVYVELLKIENSKGFTKAEMGSEDVCEEYAHRAVIVTDKLLKALGEEK